MIRLRERLRGGVLCLLAVVVLGGCGDSGGDLEPYVGTWYTGAGGEGGGISTLVIHDDGVTSYSGSADCTGKTERKGDVVRVTLDCGRVNGIGEIRQPPRDGKFTMKWDDGDTDEFRRTK